ncbi:flagellar basal body-associated FliL family protein [Modestobacter versicolor]|uniref:Flagellar protein FliL n=1 Tax=Modestobacter versicolor TaxID=429133 RepID=A0A323V9U5_9ACTN|nr:flagellar basal body-associated FliL family protein [Modestobacter versicolor]MBB3676525.1 flagellar FliL protein [Modestobacter versicolor]PZA20056.1 flagellar basal body protein FliL [Modestobacter versicolor]
MSKDKKKDAPEDEEGAKGGKKKLLIIALAAVLVIGGGAYFFLFSGSGEAAADPATETGTVVLSIEPVAINLAGGSYLKLGMALQMSALYDLHAGGGHGAAAEPDGTKALDIAITQFSGAALADVQTNREALKEALEHSIIEAYHGEVYEVRYTEYVTQ